MTHPSSLQPPESHSLYNSHHGLSYFDSACYDQQTQLIQDTKKKAEGTLSESEFWPLSKVNPRTTRFSNTLFDLQVSSLMICKQLREEALDTFHKTNTFSFGNAIWFNLFASRITNARALLLRKAEFYSDVEWCSGGWATWKWDASYSSLDLQPNNALSKFANLRKIHIEACDSEADDYGWYWEFVKSEREAMMEERLQREFGSLSQLKRIESITVVPRFNMVHHFFNDDNVSNYRMADIPMRGIGDRFANKLMDHCVDMQEIKESA